MRIEVKLREKLSKEKFYKGKKTSLRKKKKYEEIRRWKVGKEGGKKGLGGSFI